ncbi:hypothetical protein LCGC14_0372100 [marine sediment metagenome]|uniref:Uncharacterized protein n=1 Tax=marine sediment metagenome TaxID=412755 RepID=A0A0F9TAG9_9ZZZZ
MTERIKLTEDDKKLIEHFWYDHNKELTQYGYHDSISKLVHNMKQILENQEIVERLKEKFETLQWSETFQGFEVKTILQSILGEQK